MICKQERHERNDPRAHRRQRAESYGEDPGAGCLQPWPAVLLLRVACGVSGYILGVNPFNQPGVESYKKNMFALLGKPGYEEAREALLKRL